MNAVTAITADHRVLEALFGRLQKGEGEPAEVLAEIKARLLAHSVAEEEHVYPLLVREEPGEKPAVHHGVAEHREAEEKLAAAEKALGTNGFDRACQDLVDAVSHHVREEEDGILRALAEATPAALLDAAGDAFEQRRATELAGHGYTA
ncbi:hypothetical protein Afil01_27180 [Actinorhabdospora filicis]|uniref:Hemerythrin-like domain-containing protein n=1 Tax=Actinorhabdospora filicis TaxID=1785913 RepID=A0A9W6SLE1_9ACTN|nr:hemerythrin domain-containing protein [Actinorhabdospora filicis]GLZ77911.1 hypothetical protein Afil01_27180 [Actinorhabdospora filicis]